MRNMPNKRKVIIACITFAVIVLTFVAWKFLFTESGKRAIKDFQSDYTGGIERTVEVYDVNGQLIKKYEGKFDIDYDSNRIKFDDEDGKRHIIYYTTGTVIIDEK